MMINFYNSLIDNYHQKTDCLKFVTRKAYDLSNHCIGTTSGPNNNKFITSL